MQPPFKTKPLADALGETVLRWQRWTREFLPPEAIQSLPKGKYREYTAKEAFMVYLGGHLVSKMGFRIVEAKAITPELINFMDQNGLIPFTAFKSGEQRLKGVWRLVTRWEISIAASNKPLIFFYAVRGFIYNKLVEHEGFQVNECRFKSGDIPRDISKLKNAQPNWETAKILDLSSLINIFKSKVEVI